MIRCRPLVGCKNSSDGHMLFADRSYNSYEYKPAIDYRNTHLSHTPWATNRGSHLGSRKDPIFAARPIGHYFLNFRRQARELGAQQCQTESPARLHGETHLRNPAVRPRELNGPSVLRRSPGAPVR